MVGIAGLLWLGPATLTQARRRRDRTRLVPRRTGSHISASGCRWTGPPLVSLGNEDNRKMTRLSLASHPLLLGFEELDARVERAVRSGTEGYPPFNIVSRGPDSYRITVAVAGFAKPDLSVTVENAHLVIRGEQSEPDGHRVFLHRGIAGRAFQRSFVLADGVEVTAAWLDNGLLHVDLARRAPEPDIQRIPIHSAK
jgi:HSP20 family molecular chaperone IbpA